MVRLLIYSKDNNRQGGLPHGDRLVSVTILCYFGNKNLVTNLRIVTFYKV
nr:MAG TPA: hypothetical protein [Bacteriophage sp.]